MIYFFPRSLQVSQSVPVTVQLTGPQRVATLATATLPAGTQIMLSNGTVGTISAMSEGKVVSNLYKNIFLEALWKSTELGVLILVTQLNLIESIAICICLL